jgi:hypothetical protein
MLMPFVTGGFSGKERKTGERFYRTPALQNMAARIELLCDSAYRACIYTCTAVDTVVCINNPFVTSLADSAYRTGIVTCTTVDTILVDGMCQSFHLPLEN